MIYLLTVLTSLFSITVLFLMTKLMGNRQVSQLSLYDYITGITIGSIAAEMCVKTDGEFFQYLIALIIFSLATAGIAYITLKSVKLRRFFEKEAKILIMNNKIYKENFKSSKLDLSEFISAARSSGYFDLSEISIAILEPNGKISFMPKENYRPAIPEDFNKLLSEKEPPINIIMDGELIKENLKKSGKDEQWLNYQLTSNGGLEIKNVFLAMYLPDKDKLFIFGS